MQTKTMVNSPPTSKGLPHKIKLFFTKIYTYFLFSRNNPLCVELKFHIFGDEVTTGRFGNKKQGASVNPLRSGKSLRRVKVKTRGL